MKSKIINGILITFAILLLICSLMFTVFAYSGQVPFLPVKNNIVANASVINGIDYPMVDTSSYTLIEFKLFEFNSNSRYYYVFTSDDFINYIQPNSILYLQVNHELDPPPLTGFAHAVNNGIVYYDGNACPIVCGFALMSYTEEFDKPSYDAYIIYDIETSNYVLYFPDLIGTFNGDRLEFALYSVPSSTSDTSTTESLTEILGNSITFSTSAITTSVKEVFEGLFVNENNTISNYATYVVWFSGIAIALGFFKYVLRFILTMGDKK